MLDRDGDMNYSSRCETIIKGYNVSTPLLPHTSTYFVAQNSPLVHCLANIMTAKGLSVCAIPVKKSLARIASLRACFWQAERPGGLQVETPKTDIVSPRLESSYSQAGARLVRSGINGRMNAETGNVVSGKHAARHCKNRHLINFQSRLRGHFSYPKAIDVDYTTPGLRNYL